MSKIDVLICDSCLNKGKCSSLHPLVNNNTCMIYRPGNANEVAYYSLPDNHRISTTYPSGYDGDDDY